MWKAGMLKILGSIFVDLTQKLSKSCFSKTPVFNLGSLLVCQSTEMVASGIIWTQYHARASVCEHLPLKISKHENTGTTSYRQDPRAQQRTGSLVKSARVLSDHSRWYFVVQGALGIFEIDNT